MADEIYMGPAEVYVAPVGEEFPAVDEAPGANWQKLGTNGSSSITEDGIAFTNNVTKTDVMALGTIYPVKSANTAAETSVGLSIMDMTAEQMALAFGLDPDDITDTPASSGVAGTKTLVINTPSSPQRKALLIRATNGSPYDPTLPHQWEFPQAAVTPQVTAAYSKTTPFIVPMTWTAYYDADLGGVAQYTAATEPAAS